MMSDRFCASKNFVPFFKPKNVCIFAVIRESEEISRQAQAYEQHLQHEKNFQFLNAENTV